MSGEGSLAEAVQLLPTRGRVRYLLEARRERCPYCSRGTRTVSIWATPRGWGEHVAWCGHCFNATCERMTLGENHRLRHEQVLSAVAQGRVSGPWRAARPAVEDLERRGLL
jgi:hypothetical protein